MENIFKNWVPEWLIKIILFSGLMPSMVLFFLPGANIQVTAGFYGCQPSDVQLLIVLFYAGFVGFYILERRFFQYFPVKHYYIIFNVLQITNCILMYHIRDIEWIYGLRFFQGMLFASAVNLSISMIFSRLQNERAKETSYAVFFAMLLCSSPFNTFVTADFIDNYNFDTIYFYAALSFLPGLLMIIISMNYVRQDKAYPLFSLDWGSFFLYSIVITCLGYMMIYGQEVYWLSDQRMQIALLLLLSAGIVFGIRQKALKRIYIDFSIFNTRQFILGLLVLYFMYIERFSLGISNQYFAQVLNLDPIHLSYIQWFNILGIVLGVTFSMYWILAKRSVKWMWIIGFSSFLIFHQIMFFSFEKDGNDYYFYIPLIIHGLGVGLIMVPTILFVISSVKPLLGISAAAVCLCIRYLGYITSIAIMNFFKLFENAQHQEAFAQQMQVNNPILKGYIDNQTTELIENGIQSKEYLASIKIIAQQVRDESFVRYAMDYYEVMSIISICLIIIILFSPSMNTMYKKLKENLVSPA